MKFQGIMPALITPLKEDCTLNSQALYKLLDTLLDLGADGFYIGGATGEGICLDEQVRMDLCRQSVEHVKGRVPCIVHIASVDFTQAVRLAKYAQDCGADAISAIPPLFYKYSDDELYSYYKDLAAAVDIPLMIYNNPGAGVKFTVEMVSRLSQIKNITAIKWTAPDYYSVIRLKDITNGSFGIINGPDEMLVCGLAAGADGAIGSTYNITLPLVKAIYNEFKSGNHEKALQLQMQEDRIVEMLLSKSLLPAVKAILEQEGIAVGDCVAPFVKYTQEEKQAIYQEFKRLYTF